MKFTRDLPELDATDLAILDLLQENCKQPLAAIGEKVGLSAPSVVERIHKLEEAGVITDYVALLDARLLGKDIAAFIGVSTAHPRAIATKLESDGDGFTLTGRKKWVTGGPLADLLLVVASTGTDDAGKNRLRLVRVDARAPGVRIEPMPPTPFVPEIPHAQVVLEGPDLVAHRGLGEVEPLRRLREVQGLRNLAKGAQLEQLHRLVLAPVETLAQLMREPNR